MFCTVRAGAPRSTVKVGSSLAGAGAAGRDSLGTGLVVPLAGSAALVSGRGFATGAGVGVGSGACSWRGAARLLSRLPERAGGASPTVAAVAAAGGVAVRLEVRRPSRVDAAGVTLVLVEHFLYEPLVGAKIGGRELGLAWGLRHGLIRLFRYARGECQSTRLDPHTSKCASDRGVGGVVCQAPQRRLADFPRIGTGEGKHRVMRHGSGRIRHRTGVFAALVVVALAAGGCNGGDDGTRVAAPAASASAAPAEVSTVASVGELAGRLPQARRERLVEQVRQVVDGWIDAAYLAGDYPRTDFADSWPGFTPGARAKARRDGDLMSNRDLGAAIDGVEPQRRRVVLDVLSVEGRPVGVTARVVLRFATTGDTVKDVRVSGRLHLTKGAQGWQVFGYDVAKVAR